MSRYAPEAVVHFYTETANLSARTRQPGKNLSGRGIEAEILHISTDNDMGKDAGVFSITLSTRHRWHEMIGANDLVSIGFRKYEHEDEDTCIVFWGLVDTVTYSTGIEENRIHRQVHVTGRSFAKALINFELGVVADAGEIGLSIGWLRDKVTFAGESSSSIMAQLVDVFIRAYMNYEFSNGTTLTDLLQFDLSNRPGEELIGETTFVNYQGPLYNFFKELSDEPFNQLFFEVYDGQPTLVERATPFNEDDWNSLPLHEITDRSVISCDISKNDLETYTLYSVGVSNNFGLFGSQGTLGNKPLHYPQYLSKYGIRRLHRYSNFIGVVPNNLASLFGGGMFGFGGAPNITQELLPEGHSMRPGKPLTPTFITIHETDNPNKIADAKWHSEYLRNAERVGSWHYIVDDKQIIQNIPDNEQAYHAGGGNGNQVSLAVEHCVNEGSNFQQTLANGIQLVRYLMTKYNIPISNVVQHNHWSGKNCPKRIRSENLWSWYLQQLQLASPSSLATDSTSTDSSSNAHTDYNASSSSSGRVRPI